MRFLRTQVRLDFCVTNPLHPACTKQKSKRFAAVSASAGGLQQTGRKRGELAALADSHSSNRLRSLQGDERMKTFSKCTPLASQKYYHLSRCARVATGVYYPPTAAHCVAARVIVSHLLRRGSTLTRGAPSSRVAQLKKYCNGAA